MMINKVRLINKISMNIKLVKEMSETNDYNLGIIKGMEKIRDLIACYKENEDVMKK
jgi:hypothetical protein